MMDAKTITQADPQGRWFGSYGVRRCPAHDDHRPSMSVRDGADGRLLLHCHAGCGFEDVLAALGLSGGGRPVEPDPQDVERREAEARRAEAARIQRAVRLWEEADAITATLGERYLRGRSIHGAPPDALRFHPAAYCGEIGGPLPAMVAQVIDRREQQTGVHITYLAEPGNKASLIQPKIMRGRCRGGAVRLSGLATRVVVVEGIETGLSLNEMLQNEDVAVWAALSCSGVSGLDVPAGIREVTVAPDNDAAGLKAAEALAERCRAVGIPCRLMLPPAGVSDWNDAAQAALEVAP